VDYLLDTNACIALINGTSAAVLNHFERAFGGGSQIFISSVVAFELWYGVSKSSRPELNAQRLEIFLAGPVTPIAFEDDDARAGGAIRAVLEASGKPIGAYDVLIAGQALARRLTLVTANVSEFSRIEGLSWQDWAKPS
jgi:tRNA(fMet)-specific endonuclease VapC